jgi:hypothetical protein
MNCCLGENCDRAVANEFEFSTIYNREVGGCGLDGREKVEELKSENGIPILKRFACAPDCDCRWQTLVSFSTATERQKEKQTERQSDRETERQRDRETERQRDRETERQ